MRLGSLATFALLTAGAASASAQTIELKPTQQNYNEEGVAALRADDFPTAINRFKSALNVGEEANIILLNLGRAYQRAGECTNAKQTYAKVASAPAVAAPTRDEIAAVLKKYSAELPEVCPSSITVVCNDPGTLVTVDKGEAQACEGSLKLELAPGDHNIAATDNDGRTFQETTSLVEGAALEVVVEFPEPVADPVEPVVQTPPQPAEPAVVVEQPVVEQPRRTSPIRVLGATLAGVGGTTLAAGLILDATYVRNAVKVCNDGNGCSEEQHNEAKSRRGVNSAILIAGGGLVAAGAVLYLVGGSKSDAGGVSLMLTDGPGLAYTVGF